MLIQINAELNSSSYRKKWVIPFKIVELREIEFSETSLNFVRFQYFFPTKTIPKLRFKNILK